MAGQLTTHALDTVIGGGAAGMRVELKRDGAVIAQVTLDERGRGTLTEELAGGVYELCFHAAAYHRARGVALSNPPFLDVISVSIGIDDAAAHYHVPLLIAPHGYSAYRGG